MKKFLYILLILCFYQKGFCASKDAERESISRGAAFFPTAGVRLSADEDSEGPGVRASSSLPVVRESGTAIGDTILSLESIMRRHVSDDDEDGYVSLRDRLISAGLKYAREKPFTGSEKFVVGQANRAKAKIYGYLTWEFITSIGGGLPTFAGIYSFFWSISAESLFAATWGGNIFSGIGGTISLWRNGFVNSALRSRDARGEAIASFADVIIFEVNKKLLTVSEPMLDVVEMKRIRKVVHERLDDEDESKDKSCCDCSCSSSVPWWAILCCCCLRSRSLEPT
jgi:hypothetical protein